MSADLQHFVDAQDGVFEAALAELRAGQKRSHWMWFIFPQLLGLGQSAMSQRFGIHGLDQARRYLQHPVLGPRLLQATHAAQAALQANTPLRHLFGAIDSQKFISCMTLFSQAAGADSVFAQLLTRLRTSDGTTLQMLAAQADQRPEGEAGRQAG